MPTATYTDMVHTTVFDKAGNRRSLALLFNSHEGWQQHNGEMPAASLYTGLTHKIAEFNDVAGFQGDYYKCVNGVWVKSCEWWPQLAG